VDVLTPNKAKLTPALAKLFFYYNMTCLGDRMKDYEAAPLYHDGKDYVLPNDGKILIARIDGHNFSTFTRGFQKPLDPRLLSAMISTAQDLLKKFQAQTAYTQSDEITLVFVPVKDEATGLWREWPHGGRLIKLCTLFSSYAAARFNFHLEKTLASIGTDSLKEETVTKIMQHEAHFDARLFAVPNATEAYNNVYWRASYDCARNSVHGLAMCHFSPKELHGKNRSEMKQMLLEKKVDYEAMPDAFKFGTFVKKKLETIDAIDRKTGESVKTTRTVQVSFSKKDFNQEFIISRYEDSVKQNGISTMCDL